MKFNTDFVTKKSHTKHIRIRTARFCLRTWVVRHPNQTLKKAPGAIQGLFVSVIFYYPRRQSADNVILML